MLETGWVKLPGSGNSTFFNLRRHAELMLRKQQEYNEAVSLHSHSSKVWRSLVKYSGTERVWNGLESCREWITLKTGFYIEDLEQIYIK